MAAFLHDKVFDSGLNYLTTNGVRLDICTQQPATYAEATSTYTKGNKTSFVVGAAADRSGGGREVTTNAVTDGAVTGDGTVTHWAITYPTGSELLATYQLSSSQVVTNGNTFTLAAFKIGIPDPA